MELSKQTIAILKNFAKINVSMKFQEGNSQQTASPEEHIFATATLEETFPREFCIYDLNKFLAAVDLFRGSSVLHFEADYVAICNGNQSLHYRYADPSELIIANKKKKQIKLDGTTFLLQPNDISALSDAGLLLKLNKVSIVSAEGALTVSLIDPDARLSNTLSISVPDVATERDFVAIFSLDNLRLLPGGYEVTVAALGNGGGVGHFRHGDLNLNYWIATDIGSHFGK